jgi:hypothetical protein
MEILFRHLKYLMPIRNDATLEELARVRATQTGEDVILGNVLSRLASWHNYAGGLERVQTLIEGYLTARKAYRGSLGDMVGLLNEHATPVLEPPRVVRTKLGRRSAEIELSGTPAREIPVIVHQTFFPRWYAGAEPVWLVSPCLQLTFTRDRRVQLDFRRAWPEHAGLLLSWLALVGLGVFAGFRVRYRRQSQEPGRYPDPRSAQGDQ